MIPPVFTLSIGVSPSSCMTDSCAEGSVVRQQLQRKSAVGLLAFVCELSSALLACTACST